jgi:hypothetical protein
MHVAPAGYPNWPVICSDESLRGVMQAMQATQVAAVVEDIQIPSLPGVLESVNCLMEAGVHVTGR